jgi:hypothetical protein
MYEVFIDGKPLYYPGDDDYAITDPKISLSLGDSGSFALTVPATNPMHDKAITRQSIIEAKINGTTVFTGEVRERSHDDDLNEEIYAVGELAWLFDSIQPQAEYHDITPAAFLGKLIAQHNSQMAAGAKRFTVGMVDVHDPNDSLYRYTNFETTLDDMRDKLSKRLGGVFRVRHVGSTRYLDYVTEDTYGVQCSQTIRFGENLLDYADSFTVDDICSVVIPLGKKLDNKDGDNSDIGDLEKYTDVTSVNGGKNYVSNAALVSRFGYVWATRHWDDVAVPANLLTKANEWLASDQYEKLTLTVKAVDLSITDEAFEAIRVGDRVRVISEPYGLDKIFLVRSRTYNLSNPEDDTITLGDSAKVSFAAAQTKATTAARSDSESGRYQMTEWLKTAIDNTTAMMTGDRGGYKYTEYDLQGRWLADYIMDSPDKATAKGVKKVNMNGTAYSRTGIEGPYDTGIMADGTVIGKYIKAHSITAEQIDQSYTDTFEDADTKLNNRITTEVSTLNNTISLKVSGVQTNLNNVKTNLQSQITVNANGIASKVSKGQVRSQINQESDLISISANKFKWTSSYSSLTADGVLTATKAVLNNCNVSGNFMCGSETGWNLKLNSGALIGYINGSTEVGRISPNSSSYDTSTGQTYKTLQITTQGALRISSPRIAVAASSNVGTTATWGMTGSRSVVTRIEDLGGGSIRWYTGSATFINGICTAFPS